MILLPLFLSSVLIFPAQPDIKLEVISHSEKQSWAFFAPHEDERVVNSYVAEQIQAKGGIFAILRQSGGRNIHLKINDQSIVVDPNRIFSTRGIKRSIEQLNPKLDKNSRAYQVAVQRAQELAKLILTTINANQASAWIAIHNNTNGYDNDGNNGRGTISIKRYLKKLAAGANYLIKVNDAGLDEDDLFFITEPEDYQLMSNNGWNVVLQNPAVATDPNEDDGSLSVLAEKLNKRYVNIEAERAQDDFGKDSLSNQMAMVDLTFDILTQKKNDN